MTVGTWDEGWAEATPKVGESGLESLRRQAAGRTGAYVETARRLCPQHENGDPLCWRQPTAPKFFRSGR